MTGVQLAGDLGYGVPWLILIIAVAIIATTAFFIFVSLSPRIKRNSDNNTQGHDIKYKLYKYHAERYWAILVAGILIWFWFLGYPWMPPVAFEKGISSTNNTVHLVNVTAGQWFWQFKDGGIIQNNVNGSNDINGKNNLSGSSFVQPIKIKVGETVKFVAHSMDVNHGFGVLKSSKSMDSPLFQMQVVPGFDNIFYYTFKKPGVYTIRCLEYCGWNHPYMTSQITVGAAA